MLFWVSLIQGLSSDALILQQVTTASPGNLPKILTCELNCLIYAVNPWKKELDALPCKQGLQVVYCLIYAVGKHICSGKSCLPLLRIHGNQHLEISAQAQQTPAMIKKKTHPGRDACVCQFYLAFWGKDAISHGNHDILRWAHLPFPTRLHITPDFYLVIEGGLLVWSQKY